jgi:hypothetical protein
MLYLQLMKKIVKKHIHTVINAPARQRNAARLVDSTTPTAPTYY